MNTSKREKNKKTHMQRKKQQISTKKQNKGKT